MEKINEFQICCLCEGIESETFDANMKIGVGLKDVLSKFFDLN